MAGLLDYNPDPIGQGLLGLGTALMTPRALGGGMAAGLNAFNTGALQANQLKRQAQQDALREQLLQAQMQNFQSAAEERKAQAEAQRAALAQRQAQAEAQRGVLSQFGGAPTGFRDANVAITGNAPAGYTPPPAGGQITRDIAARWVAAGGDLDVLRKLAESPNFGREEVARVLERRGADGTPEQVRETKYGDQVGGAVPKPFEMRMTDIGGSVVPTNPYAPTALAKTMTPDGIASNAVARGNLGVAQANLGLSRERLELDRKGGPDGALGKPPSGYRWSADGTGLAPIPGGPADPNTERNKPPTEAQSKDFLFASRAGAANEIIGKLKDPSLYGAALNTNLDGLPLIGGALASGQNSLLKADTQRYMQAKRDFINAVLRKESGAVIGKDEFRSAELQYFPQPGDSPEVRQQKADVRRLAVQGIGTGAGPLAKGLNTSSPALPGSSLVSGQPSITDLVNKYAQPR